MNAFKTPEEIQLTVFGTTEKNEKYLILFQARHVHTLSHSSIVIQYKKK